jgi:hypothetical protein
MSLPSIKEKLHEIIETADDKKLEAIFILLQDEQNPQNPEPSYTVSELEAIYERKNNFLQGKEPVFTTEEFVRYVKQNNL